MLACLAFIVTLAMIADQGSVIEHHHVGGDDEHFNSRDDGNHGRLAIERSVGVDASERNPLCGMDITLRLPGAGTRPGEGGAMSKATLARRTLGAGSLLVFAIGAS